MLAKNCLYRLVHCRKENVKLWTLLLWFEGSSNFFPPLHYRIPRKIQISTIASIWRNWSRNAKLVCLAEFGKPAVQSVSCLGKMSYSVHISVHEDISHSIDLVILRSCSSLRMETSSLNAICTILVWIQYKTGKDKLFLYNTWRHLRGMGIYVHLLLSLALGGSEWSASYPNHLTPRERSPNTHLIGGWVSPRFGLDFLWRKRKNCCPCWNPRNSSL